MGDPWPWPADDTITRARLVAREYRSRLVVANPAACRELDRLMTELGQPWVTGVETEEIITTRDAALLLAITPRAVRAAVQREAIKPAGQDSDGYLFERSEIMRYLASRRVAAQRQCSVVPSVASG